MIEEVVVSESAGYVSPTLSDDIERELADIDARHHLWLRVRTELDEDDDTLLIIVTVPDDDPFEPTRLDRIFDSVESVIVSHMPHDFPIHEKRLAWLVIVQVPSGDSIDSIEGGEKIAGRTARYSDHVGPPTRP
ncbi:MAG: hypothetical protein M3169_08950 [Candidatus Eremiobacteraeota bacterium]|nr:hypothetical protein [Candidatus Eremiobacteraeota bacterium]